MFVIAQHIPYFFQRLSYFVGERAYLEDVDLGTQFTRGTHYVFGLALNGKSKKGVHDVAVWIVSKASGQVCCPGDVMDLHPGPLSPFPCTGARLVKRRYDLVAEHLVVFGYHDLPPTQDCMSWAKSPLFSRSEAMPDRLRLSRVAFV